MASLAETGYVWTDRYEVEGLAGLQDRVYGAGHHPNGDQEWD